MTKLALLVLLVTSSTFMPSYAGEIVYSIIVHSRASTILTPYERTIKLSATQALRLDVTNYYETIIAYYNLAYNTMLHNKLKDSARYTGIMLTLLLKAKAYSEDVGLQLLSILDKLNWSSIRIYDDSPEKLISYWLSYESNSLEDLAYTYASIALSLLEKLPLDSFVRILHTPPLSEVYLISLALIVITSAYFVVKRVSVESGGVEYEGYR